MRYDNESLNFIPLIAILISCDDLLIISMQNKLERIYVFWCFFFVKKTSNSVHDCIFMELRHTFSICFHIDLRNHLMNIWYLILHFTVNVFITGIGILKKMYMCDIQEIASSFCLAILAGKYFFHSFVLDKFSKTD